MIKIKKEKKKKEYCMFPSPTNYAWKLNSLGPIVRQIIIVIIIIICVILYNAYS